MIKRYELHDDGFDNSYMRENVDGEFVDYADHAARIAELEAALEGIAEDLEDCDQARALRRIKDALAKETT
jgi:hypothetical protein